MKNKTPPTLKQSAIYAAMLSDDQKEAILALRWIRLRITVLVMVLIFNTAAIIFLLSKASCRPAPAPKEIANLSIDVEDRK